LNIDELCGETFESKPYLKELSMRDARLFFQSRAKMLRTIKMNFRNHPQCLKEALRCSGCSLLDSQEHLRWCTSYGELRMGKNLLNDKDLVSYYREILKQREGQE
jgi:hypothetical protein